MSDLSSWRDLKDAFLSKLSESQMHEPGLWIEIWRLVIVHPWYQGELSACAERVVRRSGMPDQWIDEIKHDAMLLLARTLRHAPDLHVDREQVDQKFPGWMGTIVLRDCREALRRMRRAHTRSIPIGDAEVAVDGRSDIELQIDLSMAVDRLEDPERTVVTLFSYDVPVTEIATELNLGYWKTYRILQRGLQQLRELL